MTVVWKFSIPVGLVARHQLPMGAKFLHVACQHDPQIVELWAEVDPEQKQEVREFTVYPTGRALPEGAIHIGTTVLIPLRLVWHLYETTHVLERSNDSG